MKCKSRSLPTRFVTIPITGAGRLLPICCAPGSQYRRQGLLPGRFRRTGGRAKWRSMEAGRGDLIHGYHLRCSTNSLRFYQGIKLYDLDKFQRAGHAECFCQRHVKGKLQRTPKSEPKGQLCQPGQWTRENPGLRGWPDRCFHARGLQQWQRLDELL